MDFEGPQDARNGGECWFAQPVVELVFSSHRMAVLGIHVLLDAPHFLKSG
jgi:hypothetical protein